MGQLSYSTSQIDGALRNVIDRCVVITGKQTEISDNVIVTAGEVGTYQLVPLDMTILYANQFVAVPNGIQYIGNVTRTFLFNGTASVTSTVNNTLTRFRLFVDGVGIVPTTSVVNLLSAGSANTINSSLGITLSQNDIIDIRCVTNKACTIGVINIQLQFSEI